MSTYTKQIEAIAELLEQEFSQSFLTWDETPPIMCDYERLAARCMMVMEDIALRDMAL